MILSDRLNHFSYYNLIVTLLVHGQVTIVFVVFIGLSVYLLFVCLFVCAEFFSAVFDPISIKLGYIVPLFATSADKKNEKSKKK